MDTSVLLAVTACFVAAYLLKRLFSKVRLPPGPPGLPIVGYLPFLSKAPYLDFQSLAKRYGNVIGLQLGSAYVVILNDFESTKEAFAKDAFIGRPPESAFHINKETFETEAMRGLPWMEHRRFSLHMLRDLGLGKTNMEAQISEEIAELVEHLEENVDKPFYMNEALSSSMSNNMASLLFGKRLKYNDPGRQMLNRAIKETTAAAGQSGWKLFLPGIGKILDFLGMGKVNEISKLAHEMKSFIRREIKEHEESLNPNNIRDYIDGYLLEIPKRKDPSFSKPVVEDLVNGFFLAGSETVRTSLEWLTLTAAHFQDKQRRVQREIDDSIGRNLTPTWMDNKSMPYTQAFIMELNRWRTIVPLNVIRYAIADSEIGGYFIPKHTQIISNLWGVHHNPEYWGEDVEEFKPERFLTANEQEVKKWEHYIPFSIGKRACPGEPLAKIEVFLYFVSILQKFDIRLPEGKEADFDGGLGIALILKPQELIFTRRK